MMALFTKHIFTILHIITAAAWLGLGLRLAGQARKVIQLEAPAARAVADDVGRSVRLMNIFIALTLVFALVAFFAGGGFATYGPQYHTSILLLAILVLIQYTMVASGWKGLQAAVTASETASSEAESSRKRIAMGVGIGHLLWLILLVLMFWNKLSAAI